MEGLDAFKIRQGLVKDLKDIKIYTFEEITSTSDFLKDDFSKRDDFELCLADFQKCGRGRRGKTFESPKGRGLYMSFILSDDFINFDSILTLRIGLCVYEVLKKYRQGLGLKWVNDIYLDGKKLGGILVEGFFNSPKNKTDRGIIGIGLNILRGPMPSDISPSVAFLDRDISRNILAYEILNKIYELRDMPSSEVVKNFEVLNILKGRTILYSKAGLTYEARVLGVSDEGFLLVENKGEKFLLNSGQVSIKKLDSL